LKTMNYARRYLLALMVFMLLLAACQDEGTEATEVPEPTVAAEETPIEEASPEALQETEATEPTVAPTAEPAEETASAGTLPRVEPLDECFVEMPEGAGYECLRVEVPEFHNEENGRSIKLGVIRLLSTADTPAEPLFFAEGGPGGSNVDIAAEIAINMLDGDESVYTDLLSTRDLVFFTQRGTSYAEPALMCSEESTNPYMEVFFSSSSPQERAGAETEAYKACLEEFTEAGIDFAAYNSVESAADINSIRELLGYDQIVLYGDSYGTLLAQHVMRDYPDTLTAVILDGIVPLSSPTWDSQLDARYQSALAYLIGLCAADEACSEAYPNLSADIEAVYQKLQAEPNLVDQGGRQLNVDENLAAWAFHDAMLSPLFAPYLPLAVDSLLNDKLDDQMKIIFFPIIPNFEGISFPMHFAVVCSEAPVTSVDDAISLDEVSSVVSEYVQSDTYRYIEICSHLNLPVLSEEMKAPISTDIPVLLLSGAFDSTTPPFNAEAIAGTLPNSFSFEFPYGGHVQFLSGDACAESIVASFIADPTTEPDSRCIAEALPLQFALPAEQ
jgi:pimeloyl-ACP methyl ester carboxylesterase